MCLGIPMQIIAIDGHQARCQAGGVERDVSLFLLQGQTFTTGDYVLVHVGYAIQKVNREFARSTLELINNVEGELQNKNTEEAV